MLQNLNELTKHSHGELRFITSQEMEQERAFAELSKGNIDVIIAAPDTNRETESKVIYVPIDRGLLGFRLCLVNKSAPLFDKINTPQDFISNKYSVGLGSHWPDRLIYETNGLKVVHSPIYEQLFPMLRSKRFHCFSRSISEIDDELAKFQDYDITSDEKVVFIYPNADFIFVNPNKPELYAQLNDGVRAALENRSFHSIFDQHFANTLLEHGIYERKLLILENKQISDTALQAINDFGIASFVRAPARESK